MSSENLMAPGRLTYLQIPSLDVSRSASFYAELLGWAVQPPDSGFEAPGLIGQFTADVVPAESGGALAWFAVEDIEASLGVAVACAGSVVSQPELDGGERWLATVRDPSGNLLGLVSRAGRPPADQSE